jgi:hypothetical protein
MDPTTYDRMATYLTKSNLIFVGPPITPADHHRAMVKVIQELCREFGIGKQDASKIPTDKVYLGVAPSAEQAKPVIKIDKKEERPPTPASTPKSSDEPKSATSPLPNKKSQPAAPKETKSVESGFNKVYVAEKGGWMKALSAIAKQTESTPRADPMKIDFKIKSNDKPFRVQFWFDDVKAFAELWDTHGEQVKQKYDMTDDEYNGIVMMKSATWYAKQNPYPAYTRVITRAKMFAPCSKLCDKCLITTMVDVQGYRSGARVWSDAYRFENELCIECNNHQRNSQSNVQQQDEEGDYEGDE